MKLDDLKDKDKTLIGGERCGELILRSCGTENRYSPKIYCNFTAEVYAVSVWG